LTRGLIKKREFIITNLYTPTATTNKQ